MVTPIMEIDVEQSMAKLKELLDSWEAELGPVSEDLVAQVEADMAAADAEAGYVR